MNIHNVPVKNIIYFSVRQLSKRKDTIVCFSWPMVVGRLQLHVQFVWLGAQMRMGGYKRRLQISLLAQQKLYWPALSSFLRASREKKEHLVFVTCNLSVNLSKNLGFRFNIIWSSKWLWPIIFSMWVMICMTESFIICKYAMS